MDFKAKTATLYDEYGNIKDHYFYLLKAKSFLTFRYWSPITHKVSYESGSYFVITKFKTFEEAYNFAKNYKLPKNKWVEEFYSFI